MLNESTNDLERDQNQLHCQNNASNYDNLILKSESPYSKLLDTPNNSPSSLNRTDISSSISDIKNPENSIRSNLNCCVRYFAPIRGGSLRGSIFSLASICFDTTCLSFPHALNNMGLVPGTSLLFIMCGLAYWSLYLLLLSGRAKRIFNYRQLIKECLGSTMAYVSDLNNIIFSVGAQVAYIVTISRFFSETLTNLLGIEYTKTLKLIQMSISMIFMQIPLSLLKNISSLQYASIIGSSVLVYVMLVMVLQSVFYYNEGISEGRSIELVKNINVDYLDSFSVFLFAFSPHNGLFIILSEMSRPSLRRTKTVLNRAIFLQFFLFLIIGYAGFFSLLKFVPTIFLSRPPLNNFDPNDYLIITAKILFFCSLHCLCAINFNLLRGTISSLFFKGQDTTTFQNVYVTSFMFLISNIFAFFSTNVVEIIGIISGISVTFICYVFPVLCFVATNDLPKTHRKNIVSIIIMVVICSLGIMSTIKSLKENLLGTS